MTTDKDFGQRIRVRRRELNLSQAQLAERVGVSQQTVNRIENGQVGASRWLKPLLDVLGMDAPDDKVALLSPLPSTTPKPNASPPAPVSWSGDRLPMMGQVAGGDDGRFILNGQKIMDVLAPPQLVGVPGAYGVFVHGTSMFPRYEPGEAVFVNPHIPVRTSNYVVAQIAGDNEADDAAGYVKRFISMNSNELVLEQIEPREDVPENAPQDERFRLRFPREKVIAVHRIIASGEV